MEGESGGGQPEFLADLAGREAILSGLNEQPVDIEAGLLREGSEGRDGFLFLHISTIVTQASCRRRGEWEQWFERLSRQGVAILSRRSSSPRCSSDRCFHPPRPPARLYRARWSLSKTEAGWLIVIFFAAYVPAVPVLLALIDRVPARNVYLIGTGLTALSHCGFAMLADEFFGPVS
jgi:hypothetical protein